MMVVVTSLSQDWLRMTTRAQHKENIACQRLTQVIYRRLALACCLFGRGLGPYDVPQSPLLTLHRFGVHAVTGDAALSANSVGPATVVATTVRSDCRTWEDWVR